MKFAEIERDKVVSLQEAKKAEYVARKSEAENVVAIKGLESEENDRQHKRDLELMEIKRTYESEDKEREAHEQQQKREYKLQLIDKLKEGLSPVLNGYLDKIKETQQPLSGDLIKKRQEFRSELMESYLEGLDNDWNAYEEDYDINKEDQERIDRLVDAKFPIENIIQTQVPPEIKSLINLLREDE